jgi:hypothetical protein
VPDAQEAQQVMETLALSGATAVVAAMATDAWQATRRGMARLFSRRGGAVPAVEAQLDGDAEIVERDEDTDGARQDLVGPWRRRLLALLREFPEAQADLTTLIEEIRGQLPQAEQNWCKQIWPATMASSMPYSMATSTPSTWIPGIRKVGPSKHVLARGEHEHGRIRPGKMEWRGIHAGHLGCR